LAAAVESQNARYAKSPAREAHLAALRSGACAVVTGQQTGLFLGPLYTIYKAASTIRLARALSETWSAPVVPVFWLQTEDHDAAEIAVCHIARGSDEPLDLSIDVADDGVAVAYRTLPAAIDELLAKLGEALGRLPHAEEHLSCLQRHYRPGAHWGHAFAGVLAEVFADDGLVLLDPRDPALATLAAPVHRRALEQSSSIAAALTERVRALESAGWAAPIHVRDGAPLSFFHPEGPAGPRVRLDGGRPGRTLPDLLAILDLSPSSFSTSALLRPILQDTWLPTVAYVGGPAEVAYFAQLAPLYAAFALPMPIVVPRARMRILDESTRKTLSRRGLTPAQACRPFDDVLKAAGACASEGDDVAARLKGDVDRAIDAIAPQLCDAGPRGERAIEKTRRAMARSAEKLGRNYDRARWLRDRELVDDLQRVQARLLPRGIPQERFFGFSSFAARYGGRTFTERVLAAATPLRTDIEELAL
jgi:bacillithiol biosynthesis cysteine-adding enzyme BshC